MKPTYNRGIKLERIKMACLVAVALFSASAMPVQCPKTDLQKLEEQLKKIIEQQQKRQQKTKGVPIKLTDKDIKSISPLLLEAHKLGLNLRLTASIMILESQLNPRAVNRRTKDYGLFQLNERTIASYGLNNNCRTDIICNTRTGLLVLKYMHDRYAKREKHWYARYNVGTAKFAYKKTAYLKYANKINKIKETL